VQRGQVLAPRPSDLALQVPVAHLTIVRVYDQRLQRTACRPSHSVSRPCGNVSPDGPHPVPGRHESTAGSRRR
jgi:hypothetical protein